MMSFVVILLLLIALEGVYILLARKLRIGAEVTERSSSTHHCFTTTGGGIVFPLAALIYAFIPATPLPPHFVYMLGGTAVLGVVSFIDDLRNISATLRLVMQTIVIIATYYLWLHQYPDIYLLVVMLGVGLVNAYNFMDGISGMLVAYTVVTLGTLYFVFPSLAPALSGNMEPFIGILFAATLAFGMFNFRRRSVVFCGDVGAITIGFIILYLMVSLILASKDAVWYMFLIVYAVDTVFTIFERLFNGENILTSHKSHLYQLLANSCGIPHLTLSLIYAGLQLAINIGLLLTPDPWRWTYAIIITSLLVTAYFILKRTINKT